MRPTPAHETRTSNNFDRPRVTHHENSNNDGFDQHNNAQAAVESTALDCSLHPVEPSQLSSRGHPHLGVAIPFALGKSRPRLGQRTTSAPPTSRLWKRGTLSRTSPRGAVPHHPSWQAYLRTAALRPADASPKVHMATNSRPDGSATTACANVPSNRCWALSKTPWVFANSPAWLVGPLANGVWCVSFN